MRDRKNSIYDMYCISRYLYQCYSNIRFWVCLDSAVGRGADSAVLGGVVEVVSSNPAVGNKNIFRLVDLLYLSIYRKNIILQDVLNFL